MLSTLFCELRPECCRLCSNAGGVCTGDAGARHDDCLVTCRAARFCYGAAHGGQIMVPLHIAQELVHAWTGLDLNLLVSGLPERPRA